MNCSFLRFSNLVVNVGMIEYTGWGWEMVGGGPNLIAQICFWCVFIKTISPGRRSDWEGSGSLWVSPLTQCAEFSVIVVKILKSTLSICWHKWDRGKDARPVGMAPPPTHTHTHTTHTHTQLRQSELVAIVTGIWEGNKYVGYWVRVSVGKEKNVQLIVE